MWTLIVPEYGQILYTFHFLNRKSFKVRTIKDGKFELSKWHWRANYKEKRNPRVLATESSPQFSSPRPVRLNESPLDVPFVYKSHYRSDSTKHPSAQLGERDESIGMLWKREREKRIPAKKVDLIKIRISNYKMSEKGRIFSQPFCWPRK